MNVNLSYDEIRYITESLFLVIDMQERTREITEGTDWGNVKEVNKALSNKIVRLLFDHVDFQHPTEDTKQLINKLANVAGIEV